MGLIPNNPVDFMADLTGTDAEVIRRLIRRNGKYPGLEAPDFSRITHEEVRRFSRDNGFVRLRSLTPDQAAALEGWLARWKSACLVTRPAARRSAERAIRKTYAILDRPAPIIVWVDSPLIAQLAGGLRCDMRSIANRTWDDTGENPDPWDALWSARPITRYFDQPFNMANWLLTAAVEEEVLDIVGDAADMERGHPGPVRRVVESAIEDLVRTGGSESSGASRHVGHLKASLRAAVSRCEEPSGGGSGTSGTSESDARSHPEDVADVWFCGEAWEHLWSNRLSNVALMNPASPLCLSPYGAALTSFFRDICGLELPWLQRARHLENLALSASWWWPDEEFVFVSERPLHLAVDVQGRPHSETGPAIEMRDGWQIYALEGRIVPQWLAITPGEMLEPWRFPTIENAEVRAVFVRKVGIDRLCSSLGARSIDKRGTYELLMLDLQDGRRRPYLRMLNPSTGTWHLEGVPPKCRTVARAIAWRNDTPDCPAELT